MRKIAVKTFGPEPGGKAIEYFEGYCDTSEISTLPTELVADGSNVIDTGTGDWYFFNEKTKTWIKRLNIQEA